MRNNQHQNGERKKKFGTEEMHFFLFTELRRVPLSALFLLLLSWLDAYSFVRIHLEQAHRIKRMPQKRVKPTEEMKTFILLEIQQQVFAK